MEGAVAMLDIERELVSGIDWLECSKSDSKIVFEPNWCFDSEAIIRKSLVNLWIRVIQLWRRLVLRK